MTDNAEPLARFLVPLRRWWPLIAATVVLGIILSLATRPDPPEALPGSTEIVEPGVAYRATHVLLRTRASPATENLELVAMLARQGSIAARVADQLGDRVEPGAVDTVTIEATKELGTLSIHAVQPTAERATLLASTYAHEIVRHFDGQVEADHEERIAVATARLATLDERIQQLLDERQDLEEGGLGARLNESELNVLVDQYGILQGELRGLSTGVAGGVTFETLQEPTPIEIASGGTRVIDLPASGGPRLGLAVFVSLLVGGALAFGVDRIDPRLRTRDDAEEAVGLPVVAEVPRVPRRVAGASALVVVTDPRSDVAEAYRSLRLSVEYESRWRLDRLAPGGEDTVATATRVSGQGTPHTLLVTSPSIGDGKTTVTANLSASLAEHGRRVLVVDCDFRRAGIAAMLGAPSAPGLRDLGALTPGALGAIARVSGVRNVGVVASGHPGLAPAWFVENGSQFVEQARPLADVVVFDTGPMQVTSEAAALVPWVDSVLLITRSGRTRRIEARRSVEQLARLGATVGGVVFVGSEHTSRMSSYYRSLRRTGSREGAGV